MPYNNQGEIQSNFSCLKTLRLKSQLLILICLLIAFTVVFLVCSNYLHTAFVQLFFTDSSNQIYTITSDAMISTQLFRYNSYFSSLFAINGNTLIQFHQIYTYIRNMAKQNSVILNDNFNMDFGGQNNIPKVVNIPKGMAVYNISYSFLCYSNKTKLHTPFTAEEQLNIKTQETLQAFGQILFRGKTTQQSFLYSYIKRDEMLMTYPCLQRFDIDIYIPENRSWYMELTRNYKLHKPYDSYNYSITAPYLLFKSTSIGLSMALPVVDDKFKQIGGIAFDLIPSKLFAYTIQSFGKDFTLIYLVSLDGILIMHPYKVTPDQLPLYVYNETITGFNVQDWERMNNQDSKSNCTGFSHEIKFKCIYNSYFRINMFASLQKLAQFNISILVVVSSAEFNRFQNEYNLSLLQSLTQQFRIHMIEQISTFALLSIIIIIVTTILFFPIELIISQTISSLQKKKCRNQNLSIFSISLLSRQIIELYNSCQHFHALQEGFSFSKNQQCQLIENYEYPNQEPIYISQYIEHHGFQKLKFKIRENNQSIQLLTMIQSTLKSENLKVQT